MIRNISFGILIYSFLFLTTSSESLLKTLEKSIEDDYDAMEADMPVVERIKAGKELIKEDTNDEWNSQYMDSDHMPDLYSLVPANYTGPISVEAFPKFSSARIEREIYIREQK
jgi:hypothetical protein